MKFIPDDFEQNQIRTLSSFNSNEYTLIRLTETMYNKNNIDANSLMQSMLKWTGIVNFDELPHGGDFGITVPTVYLAGSRRNDAIMKFYRVNNKRGDERFSIYRIKQQVKNGMFDIDDMLYISPYEKGKLCVINISVALPQATVLSTLFGSDKSSEAINELIPRIRRIAASGYLRNSKGAGKVSPKDAGDTLESLLGIRTNNRRNADVNGLIELKTKTAKNMDTLFTLRPRFEGTPIALVEPNDRNRVSAFTRYYGYETGPDTIQLYITIGTQDKMRNGYGFYLDVDESSEQVNLWAPNPVTNIPELSCYWYFDDLRQVLEEKHPTTLWLTVQQRYVENFAEFKYTKVEMTKSPQFATFISLIGSGKVTYDWRGRTTIAGPYHGKNHGNAWRISPQDRDLLFATSQEISLE